MAFNPMKIEKSNILEKNLEYTLQYVENFIIVCLDAIPKRNDHITKMIKKMQAIINDIEVFHNSDACIDHITNLKNECVLFIISNSVDRCILILAQDLPVISSVYMS
jgi:hypothetical protein